MKRGAACWIRSARYGQQRIARSGRARELYYEGEAYVVFAVTPTAVTRVIASYGGGC